MPKIFVLSFLSAVFFISHTYSQSASEKGYKIIGTVTGFADGTKIYLSDPMSGTEVIMDSAFIVKNKFHFTGRLNNDAMNLILRVDYPYDYKYFWLENNRILFNAEKGHFRDAIITGSQTQKESDQLSEDEDKEKDGKQADISFIQNHPNSMLSALLLNIYGTTWGKETVSPLFNSLSDKIKNSIYGKNIKAFIDLNKAINIGDRFVDFSQKNLEGKEIRLSDYNGKVVLLEFWGSGCGPCRTENPQLVNYYNEFKPKGFEILGVTLDAKREYWETAVRYDKIPWQTVCDLNGWKNKVALMYGIGALPTNYLINSNGIIIAKDLRGDELRKKLLEIFK